MVNNDWQLWIIVLNRYKHGESPHILGYNPYDSVIYIYIVIYTSTAIIMELYPQVEGLQHAESIDISCCDTSKTMHKQSFMTTSFECVLFPAKIDLVLPHRSSPRYPANICLFFFQLESI